MLKLLDGKTMTDFERRAIVAEIFEGPWFLYIDFSYDNNNG